MSFSSSSFLPSSRRDGRGLASQWTWDGRADRFCIDSACCFGIEMLCRSFFVFLVTFLSSVVKAAERSFGSSLWERKQIHKVTILFALRDATAVRHAASVRLRNARNAGRTMWPPTPRVEARAAWPNFAKKKPERRLCLFFFGVHSLKEWRRRGEGEEGN